MAVGRGQVEGVGGQPRRNGVVLCSDVAARMHMQVLPPNMVGPVGDWDFSTLCNAVLAPSLKQKLAEMSPGASPRRAREV